MVSWLPRGDMGVEIPAEEVPHVQKEIIKKCNAKYKPKLSQLHRCLIL